MRISTTHSDPYRPPVQVARRLRRYLQGRLLHQQGQDRHSRNNNTTPTAPTPQSKKIRHSVYPNEYTASLIGEATAVSAIPRRRDHIISVRHRARGLCESRMMSPLTSVRVSCISNLPYWQYFQRSISRPAMNTICI
jgi:hypothetical protein